MDLKNFSKKRIIKTIFNVLFYKDFQLMTLTAFNLFHSNKLIFESKNDLLPHICRFLMLFKKNL